jgi:hypothetical protein
MTHNAHAPEESHRLEALIRHRVGWQVDDLQVLVGEHGLILEGHARCGCARRMAQEEAARLSGLPVENRIAVM